MTARIAGPTEETMATNDSNHGDELLMFSAREAQAMLDGGVASITANEFNGVTVAELDDIRARTMALARAAGIDGEIKVDTFGRFGDGFTATVRMVLGPLRAVGHTRMKGDGDVARAEAEATAWARLYRAARLAAQRAALWSVVHGAARAVEKHRERATELRERAARLRAEADAAEREAGLHESALTAATAQEATVLAGLTDAQRAAADVVRADAAKGMP